MKKISLFPTQDGTFRPWEIAESDVSQDGKSLFSILFSSPSKQVPTNEDAKRYTGIKSTARLRRAFKELELRGVLEYVSHGIVLKDRVLEAPAGEVLPLKGEKKVNPEPKLQEEFRVWYLSEFMKRTGERYPFAYGKDNTAVNRLISNYGLEGAKAKVLAAFEYRSPNFREEEFFKKCALSLTTLASVASRLVQSQINEITDHKKWDGHKAREMKL